MPLYAIAIFAIGTFLFRLIGPILRKRFTIPDKVQTLSSEASVVMLLALATTSSLLDGHAFAGWARPAGVMVGMLLTSVRVPFPVIVIAAGAATAGLRFVGIS
jgi:branched-subunit amino acid transport protein